MANSLTLIGEVQNLKPPQVTLGLHCLHPPSDFDAAADVDIVAVHGLGGDSYSTWTRKKGSCEVLWLRDLLPSSVPQGMHVRIMTYGYDATAFLGPFDRAKTGRTFTFAQNLLNDLDARRVSPKTQQRPIVFVGHSLGGIVIKEALRYANSRSGLYGSILDATRSLVFFGTPHQGADIATWGRHLSKIGNVLRVRSTKVLKELESWSDVLVQLTNEFSGLVSKFELTTYYEDTPLHGIIIVEHGSALLGQPREQVRSLSADHMSICKFFNEDSNWNIVQLRLNVILERARGAQAPVVSLPFPQLTAGPNIVDAGDEEEEELIKRLRDIRAARTLRNT